MISLGQRMMSIQTALEIVRYMALNAVRGADGMRAG